MRTVGLIETPKAEEKPTPKVDSQPKPVEKPTGAKQPQKPQTK